MLREYIGMNRVSYLRRYSGLCGLVAFLLPLALAGCGPRTGTVSGTVTYKGQALGNGSVMFLTKDGKAQSGLIGSDGSYTVANVPSGPVTITVQTTPPAGAQGGGMKVKGTEMPDMGGGTAAGKYVPIPDKYKNKDQSGLSYDVTAGPQKHDIQLQ